jgi:hypothetical protein
MPALILFFSWELILEGEEKNCLTEKAYMAGLEKGSFLVQQDIGCM